MIYGSDNLRAKYKNRQHFSKEPLAALCTTDIVPKGSPLLVHTCTQSLLSREVTRSYSMHLQDHFHSMTHWLQACGILSQIKYTYMNREPLKPLPKQSEEGDPLNFIQLVMLWFIWASGATVGLFVFLLELLSGVRDRHKQRKAERNTQNIRRAWPRLTQDNGMRGSTNLE